MHVEALLEYFHLTCKPAVADMCESARVKLLSNVDVAATEAMVKCQDLKNRLNACLLDATQRFHKQIADHMAQIKMPWPKGFVPEVDGDTDPRHAWIDFPARKKKRVQERIQESIRARAALGVTAVAVHTPLAPPPATPWIELPWKAWLKAEAGPTLRDTAGGTAAVAAVLRMLHRRGCTEYLPITIVGNGKEVRVITTMDGESGAIMIPPCVTKYKNMYENSLHPRRARITYHQNRLVREAVPVVVAPGHVVKHCMFKSGVMGGDVDNDTKSVFVIPEFRAPEDCTTAQQAASVGGTRTWRWDGTESMHPYWAVRRLTRDQMISTCTHDDARVTRCRIKEVAFTMTSVVATTIGSCSAATDCCTVIIPMLTNEEKFCKGMELVIEVDTPARALRTRKHAREDDKSPRTYATPATKKSRVDDEV